MKFLIIGMMRFLVFFIKEFFFSFISSLDPFNRRHFLFSINGSFDGVMDMLHVNAKIHFPKRFSFLFGSLKRDLSLKRKQQPKFSSHFF